MTADDLWARCQFWDDDHDRVACGRDARSVADSDRGRVIPCCPVHDPGTSRPVTLDDLEALIVQEVLES